ncbi:MAG: hypothetical protein PVH61_31530 [Candidatus Aminicenantes bacterium]
MTAFGSFKVKMNKIKINIFAKCSVILVLLLTPTFLLTDSLQLRLPVHINISPGTADANRLSKDDFTLFVNGSQREINQMEIKTRRINKTSDLVRHFVLSFHMDNVHREVIMEGVRYFIDHILDRSDSLTVLTPLKSYQMKMDSGKAAVFDAIEKLLKTDCDDYKSKREILIQQLEKELLQLHMLTWSDAVYRNARTILSNFFKFSRQVIKDLKDHFLSPYPGYQRVVKELPLKGDGETWWIHFQQRLFKPYPAKLKGVINRWIIIQSTGRIIIPGGDQFKQLAKKMPLSPEFPTSILLEALLKKNICFNAICWGNIDYENATPLDNPRPEIEEILELITNHSGGKTITTAFPEQGLKELQQHTAQFYQLVFPFNGKIEAKKIQLTLVNQQQKETVQLSYPRQLETDEIQSLVQKLSRERVKILDFDVKGSRVDFGVTGFHREEPDIVGLLNVRAELYHDEEESQPVFRAVNTLHAKKEKIHLSIPIPRVHTGPFKLRVSVCDLIANQLDVVERRIRL